MGNSHFLKFHSLSTIVPTKYFSFNNLSKPTISFPIIYVLMLTTYRNNPPELRAWIPVDKRVFSISPCPADIREQAPYFELAYQLERHVAASV